MSEQELDLFKLSACLVAQSGTGTAEIVRRNAIQTTFRGPRLYDAPNDFRAEAACRDPAGLVDRPKNRAGRDASSGQPVVDRKLDPGRDWHRSNVTTLANKIGDDPVLFSLLEVFDGRALAIEAKLGDTRLGPNDFRQRFCVPCEVSGHKDRRLRGNMIAVLERSFADECPTSTGITCTSNGSSWPLSVAWWLFLRRPVISEWKRFTGERVLSNAARIGEFERLVKIYGT